ncbi:MAG: asparagine synthase C-terminal domain-containing protein, partial [Gammaproteobacteria bacterium]|nr:asparagine synthase C-terminal domain-containing protein [Gammaproteobacteria bacterium]
WRYWSALKVKQETITFNNAQEKFDALMETVMLEHMRSDVPFGLFLSGGVDSSVLLALLSRYKNEPIRTFSVGFQDTSITDELPAALRTAHQFGSQHTEIRPTRTEILHSLPYTVWAADDLMRDYANLPTALLAQRASQELKVVFSGEGGDEVFAGYGRYRSSAVQRWLKSLIAPGSGGFRTRDTLRGKWPDVLFSSALQKNRSQSRNAFKNAWQSCPGNWTALQRMQYVDLESALPDNLLVKLDRMLMGASLEGRVPFVDHRVVEFGLSLPDRLKVQGRTGKYFLKRWASRFLPQEQLFARKKGFSVPVGEWLKDDLPRLKKTLPAHPAIKEWFRPTGVQQLIDQYETGGPVSQTVLALLQFAVWHDLFIDGSGQRPEHNQDPVSFITP